MSSVHSQDVVTNCHLFGKIRPATNQLMGIPLFCQCYIYKTRCWPLPPLITQVFPALSEYSCHLSLSLSLLHEMQSESAPFFNTRMLPISVYSENAVPRPAFSACFRGFCCNRARTTNHCFSRLGVTVYHTSVNASRMIDLAS
jgi:hypothetical protein